jgi:hypothetical protein
MNHRHATVILSAALGLTGFACKSETACKGGIAVEIAGNHGHSLEIPASAIERGVGGTYPLRGGDHEHVVALRDADLERLKKGEELTTRATSVNGHTHEIGLKCASE